MQKISKFNPSSKGRPDKVQENYAVYFKHDGCTMLLFTELSMVNALIRKSALKKMYSDWCGHFIVTKGKKRK